jgi:two-component system chemotaxis response regulator CheB
VTALRALAGAFDPRWQASIFITIHIGRRQSRLPELLRADCPLPVTHARDRELIERGHVYIAPPDRHLCVESMYIRLSHGPRENWTRPAIDPMFRSAAHNHAPALVGVLLTGHLSDGVNGLHEIHRRGCCTIVQDPDEAVSPEMPRNAVRRMTPDYVLPLRKIPAAIGNCLADLPRFPRHAGAVHG